MPLPLLIRKRGIDGAETVDTVHTRRAPMIPVDASPPTVESGRATDGIHEAGEGSAVRSLRGGEARGVQAVEPPSGALASS